MVVQSKQICVVENNAMTNGGAIYAARENNCSLKNSLLSRNIVHLYKTIIFYLIKWDYYDSIGFVDNEALQKGGALCFYFNNSIALVNSVLKGNV